MMQKCKVFFGGLCWVLVLAMAGCVVRRVPAIVVPEVAPTEVRTFVVTGYCSCRHCCGWHRNWMGRPVVSRGPGQGTPKRVGVTASGVRARRGTVAGPPELPFGTVLYIPGYGPGRVEDRGGAIAGNRLDVYFPTHAQALRWGRKSVAVEVWMPGEAL